MCESKQWGKWFANVAYGEADKKKMNRKEFEKKIAESHACGMVKMGEMILDKVEDPEVRGDIHILITEAKKIFDKMNPGKSPLATIERTVRIYEK